MTVSLQIDIPGKPKPKARPRMIRNKIWTPSTPHENDVAMHMIQHQGAFKGQKGLAFLCWFYGADTRADGMSLWVLARDAAITAEVIDDVSSIVYGAFEQRRTDAESNPFADECSTRVRIGEW